MGNDGERGKTRHIRENGGAPTYRHGFRALVWDEEHLVPTERDQERANVTKSGFDCENAFAMLPDLFC